MLGDVESSAAWRRPESRLSETSDFTHRVLGAGQPSPPTFVLPYFKKDLAKLGRLHVMGLGVTADQLGTIWELCADCLPGRSSGGLARGRCGSACKSGTGCVRSRAASPSKKLMKLKAKGAQMKELVPFACQMAEQLLDKGLPLRATVRIGCERL